MYEVLKVYEVLKTYSSVYSSRVCMTNGDNQGTLTRIMGLVGRNGAGNTRSRAETGTKCSCPARKEGSECDDCHATSREPGVRRQTHSGYPAQNVIETRCARLDRSVFTECRERLVLAWRCSAIAQRSLFRHGVWRGSFKKEPIFK